MLTRAELELQKHNHLQRDHAILCSCFLLFFSKSFCMEIMTACCIKRRIRAYFMFTKCGDEKEQWEKYIWGNGKMGKERYLGGGRIKEERRMYEESLLECKSTFTTESNKLSSWNQNGIVFPTNWEQISHHHKWCDEQKMNQVTIF